MGRRSSISDGHMGRCVILWTCCDNPVTRFDDPMGPPRSALRRGGPFSRTRPPVQEPPPKGSLPVSTANPKLSGCLGQNSLSHAPRDSPLMEGAFWKRLPRRYTGSLSVAEGLAKRSGAGPARSGGTEGVRGRATFRQIPIGRTAAMPSKRLPLWGSCLAIRPD